MAVACCLAIRNFVLIADSKFCMKTISLLPMQLHEEDYKEFKSQTLTESKMTSQLIESKLDF